MEANIGVQAIEFPDKKLCDYEMAEMAARIRERDLAADQQRRGVVVCLACKGVGWFDCPTCACGELICKECDGTGELYRKRK